MQPHFTQELNAEQQGVQHEAEHMARIDAYLNGGGETRGREEGETRRRGDAGTRGRGDAGTGRRGDGETGGGGDE